MLLRADLENENNTIRNYRERVQQCETLGEYAIAEDIREISVRSRNIRRTWRRLWAKTCPMSRARSVREAEADRQEGKPMTSAATRAIAWPGVR
jgi:hypothetical protein